MRLRNYPTKRKLLKDIESLRAENRELKRKLKAYESSKPETVGFECVGVENANDYKVV
jgi:hypothetical protein